MCVCVCTCLCPCVYVCSQGWKMSRGIQDLAYNCVLALWGEMVLPIRWSFLECCYSRTRFSQAPRKDNMGHSRCKLVNQVHAYIKFTLCRFVSTFLNCLHAKSKRILQEETLEPLQRFRSAICSYRTMTTDVDSTGSHTRSSIPNTTQCLVVDKG